MARLSRPQRFLLYLRTARHLRWRQIVYRPVRRLQQKFVRFNGNTESLNARDLGALRAAVIGWGPADPDTSVMRAEEVINGRFTFIGRSEDLARIDWTCRYVSHIWSYNLHYFDYALDLAWAFRLTGNRAFIEKFVSLADSWIRGTASNRGDGWEPYPLSVRTINWAHALLLLYDEMDTGASQRIAASMFNQLAFLEKRLEWQVMGNHLQKNLAALVTGSVLYSGPRSQHWQNTYVKQLWDQLDDQVLDDGGHVERSPLYHAIALNDFLSIVGLLRASGNIVSEDVLTKLRAMSRAFVMLSRPDGTLHLFHDSANGIGPPRDWLVKRAEGETEASLEEPEGAWSLPQSAYFGYFSLESNERFAIDCGQPGPPHQPGHAHASLLSFELDVDGLQIVVDSGVNGYAEDEMREYFRSTRAHNTVSIDLHDQSELWGKFRMARRALPLRAHAGMTGKRFVFSGAYKPYFDSGIIHARTVRKDANKWIVDDVVTGAKGARIQSFVHFHPECNVKREGQEYVVARGRVTVRLRPYGHSGARTVMGAHAPLQGWHASHFGGARPAPTLVFEIKSAERVAFGYTVYTQGSP